jgi:hypothetical protein
LGRTRRQQACKPWFRSSPSKTVELYRPAVLPVTLLIVGFTLIAYGASPRHETKPKKAVGRKVTRRKPRKAQTAATKKATKSENVVPFARRQMENTIWRGNAELARQRTASQLDRALTLSRTLKNELLESELGLVRFSGTHAGLAVSRPSPLRFRLYVDLPPQALEPSASCSRIAGRVARISVSHEVLEQPEIPSPIAQGIASTVAKHVRPHVPEARPFSRLANEIVDSLTGHGLATFGNEEPGELVLTSRQITLDGAELVAFDWLLGVERILRAPHPDTGLFEIQLIPAHGYGFRDPERMAVDHEEHEVVTDAVTALLGRLEQTLDLPFIQEVFGSLMGVRRPTLDTSPFGHRSKPR